MLALDKNTYTATLVIKSIFNQLVDISIIVPDDALGDIHYDLPDGWVGVPCQNTCLVTLSGMLPGNVFGTFPPKITIITLTFKVKKPGFYYQGIRAGIPWQLTRTLYAYGSIQIPMQLSLPMVVRGS